MKYIKLFLSLLHVLFLHIVSVFHSQYSENKNLLLVFHFCVVAEYCGRKIQNSTYFLWLMVAVIKFNILLSSVIVDGIQASISILKLHCSKKT